MQTDDSAAAAGSQSATHHHPRSPTTAPHLLDASMFWSASGNGGVHRALTSKRDHLRARGWRHTLLAPGARGTNQIDAGGLRIPASGGYRFVVDRAHAARAIEAAAPDVVEAADPYTLGWAVLDACARLRVPSVAFCHSDLPALIERLVAGACGMPSARLPRIERSTGRYLARLYRRFDVVLAPSRHMTERLRALGVTQAETQPLGVDTTVFTPQANDPRWRYRLEEELNAPAGARLVLYAGRFAPEKNLDVLVAAVRRLGPGHLLLAVGSGPRPPVGEHVRVLPAERDSARLARLMATCDVFAHCGDQETFGLAALEAMACGTPVVAHAGAGLGELVDGAGITVASKRPEDWAAALAAALSDPQSPLAWKALTRARAHDVQRVLERLERRYRQALHAGRVPIMAAPARP